MEEGNWLSEGIGGGMASRVEVLEVELSSPLANGVVVWWGRLAIPGRLAVQIGTQHRLTLEGKGTGQVWILEVSTTEVTFCGRLV